ncbi:histidine phosphatase family protein [Candidatus Bathyarchaeota archaeon]|nr:histidine phosphatase family protein [Candidatus Bathyarchaeota archaeon]
MICRLFVFRHAESYDNSNQIFCGWRDPDLTPKGILQAGRIAEQLKQEEIDYAFTSHLLRARRTLEIVLKAHPNVPVFVDDRLIERCYGTLQGKSNVEIAAQRPEWFARVHRGYDSRPPRGESLEMVERRTLSFVAELEGWLRQYPGNVAISCHNNSMRAIRRFYEHLSLEQMLELENPHDRAMEYGIHFLQVRAREAEILRRRADWDSVLVPPSIRLATDPRNPLRKHY